MGIGIVRQNTGRTNSEQRLDVGDVIIRIGYGLGRQSRRHDGCGLRRPTRIVRIVGKRAAAARIGTRLQVREGAIGVKR